MNDKILNSLMEKLNIKNINPDTKCWVVRCEKGSKYFKSFKYHGIAAIGHIDALGYKKLDTFLNNLEDSEIKLQETIKKNRDDLEDSSIRRIAKKYINQTLTFINEIKENDYVITIGSESVLIGYATKYCGLSNENLTFSEDMKNENLHGEHYNIEMSLSLRREVLWEYEIPRNKLPSSLFKATLSMQTVYEYSDIHSLLHMIYPIYIFNNQLFKFSINIEQERDLSNFQISQLFNLINELEFVFKNGNKITKSNYDLLLSEFDNYEMSVKANFMSPGETWVSLILNYEEMATAIVVYSMLFGNSKLGFDGIIDKDIRHLIANKLLNNKNKTMKDELKLSPPEFDTD